MAIAYRNARVGDAEAIDQLYRAIFCDTFGHLYSAENLSVFLANVTVENWRQEIRDPRSGWRLAYAGDELVGFVKLGPLTLPIEPGAAALELSQIYVLKEHHGSGIAAHLMNWAIGAATRRGAGELYLIVYVDNHRARRFYVRFGFVGVGCYTYMVGNHADEEVIMRKLL